MHVGSELLHLWLWSTKVAILSFLYSLKFRSLMMSTYAKCCRACVLLYVYISLPLYSYVCVYVCVCVRDIER